LDRDSDYYQREHYRAHWQPLCAIFGLFACIIVVIFSGWPAIYLLRARDTLSTVDAIKDSGSLAGYVVGAYSGVSHETALSLYSILLLVRYVYIFV
jgi:amino acid transporter